MDYDHSYKLLFCYSASTLASMQNLVAALFRLDPTEMPNWPIERTMQHYFGCHTDLIICGHTHVERIQCYGAVWVVNPGSPTFPHHLAAQPGTVGIVTLQRQKRAQVAICDLKTLRPIPELSRTL